LTQSYVPSSDESDPESASGSDISAQPPSPETLQYWRKVARIEDVSELNIDLLSLSSTPRNKPQRPLPPTPIPPVALIKHSPSLEVAPLRINKKPVKSAKPILSVQTAPMVSPRPVRLLIASIGNPKPYHSTRHSAGHHLLQALQSTLHFPPLSKTMTGLVSSGADVGIPQFTLWQSTSLMNVSGKNLLQAWKAFTSSQEPSAVTGVVVLHDELESSPGVLKVRKGDGSAKGHNGIKSIQDSFRSAGVLSQLGSQRYVRIGIGIGRPSSRDQSDVSAYVLGQLTATEKKRIEDKAEELLRILDRQVAVLENS